EPELNLLHADALQRLVVLSHGHGQECGFIPDVKPPLPGNTSQLVWECVAGHSFSWGVPGTTGDCTPTTDHHGEEQGEGLGCSSSPVTGRRRSLRQAGLAAESTSRKDEAHPEEAARSPMGDGDQQEDPRAGSDDGDDGNVAPQVSTETGTTAKDHESPSTLEEKAEQEVEPQEEEEEEEDEDFAEDDDLTYTDDLRDENYHPSLDSDSEPQRRQNQTKARKKPVKEEQPQHELNLPSSSPSEEKTGRV
ncbi:zinc finger protein 692-like, partial [Antrostomus carolinensis]|uniref:zinc finger protein 692-like n=1 Tax=Antrostomus carolinensis TaxID=279965 RepID=UPI0010A9917F